MRITTVKLSLLSLLIAIAFLSQAQERLVIDKVIAKVGSETIFLSDVEAQYSYMQANNPTITEEAKCQVLESIIGQKLIVHQAKLDSIEISDEEVNGQLDLRIQSVLRQMNGDEQLFESQYGMTVGEMKENLRDNLEQQILAERMQGQLLSDVVITPKEVKQFFAGIPTDSIPYLNAEVEISEIVMKPKVNAEERTKSLNKILNIRKRIVEGGEDFGELAKVHSDDLGSARQFGDLGFAERGTYVPDFEAAAYGLKLNEITDPVETEFGFHIIQMLERRGTKIRLRHILVKPEITSDDLDKTRAVLDSLKLVLDDGKVSFSEAVRIFSIDQVPSYHNGGLIQNPNTGKTIFETVELPSEIYFAIEDMDVGDISTALEYPTPQGETFFRIIKLRSRTNPHKANLEQDYTKIQRFAKESKKSEYFTKWLQQRLKETYINIDKNYINCPNIEDLLDKKS